MTIAERKIKLVEKILNLDDEYVVRLEKILESESIDNSTIVAQIGRAHV